ncbi:hypothetical protein FACS18945_3610 [Bacteroidia bacterium]|nr:hypothetical protein FACS18945_3610 [Bacteroidia bacterium]
MLSALPNIIHAGLNSDKDVERCVEQALKNKRISNASRQKIEDFTHATYSNRQIVASASQSTKDDIMRGKNCDSFIGTFINAITDYESGYLQREKALVDILGEESEEFKSVRQCNTTEVDRSIKSAISVVKEAAVNPKRKRCDGDWQLMLNEVYIFGQRLRKSGFYDSAQGFEDLLKTIKAEQEKQDCLSKPGGGWAWDDVQKCHCPENTHVKKGDNCRVLSAEEIAARQQHEANLIQLAESAAKAPGNGVTDMEENKLLAQRQIQSDDKTDREVTLDACFLCEEMLTCIIYDGKTFLGSPEGNALRGRILAEIRRQYGVDIPKDFQYDLLDKDANSHILQTVGFPYIDHYYRANLKCSDSSRARSDDNATKPDLIPVVINKTACLKSLADIDDAWRTEMTRKVCEVNKDCTKRITSYTQTDSPEYDSKNEYITKIEYTANAATNPIVIATINLDCDKSEDNKNPEKRSAGKTISLTERNCKDRGRDFVFNKTTGECECADSSKKEYEGVCMTPSEIAEAKGQKEQSQKLAQLQTNVNSISASIGSLRDNALNSDRSVWKTQEGKFNYTRLAVDAGVGAVVGTAGGLIVNSIMKKKQTANGFEAMQCSIGGQYVADWGDEFTTKR